MLFIIPHPRLFQSSAPPLVVVDNNNNNISSKKSTTSTDADGGSDGCSDDCSDSVAPSSLISHTPIEELAHPVLLALEGENRVLYDFEELVRVLATAGPWPLHIPVPDIYPHLLALRARDASDVARPHASYTASSAVAGLLPAKDPLINHLEVGYGPLTRKRFTSAHIAPVRLIGGPPSKGNVSETLNLLLHRVVLDGFIDRARTLIDMRADPSYRPVIPATAAGNLAKLKCFADSALAVAVRSSCASMVKALLPPTLSAEQRKQWASGVAGGHMPLVIIAASIDPTAALLKELLKAGADPNARDIEGRCALALPSISLDCVKELHAAHALIEPLDVTCESPLAVACQGGRLPVVRFMLNEMWANANGACRSNGCAPLHFAVGSGFEDIATLLVAAGADVTARDADDRNAFHYAARANRGLVVMEPVMRKLREAPMARQSETLACLDVEGFTPLMTAVRLGHTRSVSALLALKAQVSDRGGGNARTALHVAAAMGREPVLLQLLASASASDLALRDDSQRTPVEAALYNGNEDALRVFINNRIPSTLTYTMLAFAVRHGMWPVATMMVREGRGEVPFTDAKDREQPSILHELVASPHFIKVRLPLPEPLTELLTAILVERAPTLIAYRKLNPHNPKQARAPLQHAYMLGNLCGAHALMDFLTRASSASVATALGSPAVRTLLHDMAEFNDDIGLTLLEKLAPDWLKKHVDAQEPCHGATPLCLGLAMLRGSKHDEFIQKHGPLPAAITPSPCVGLGLPDYNRSAPSTLFVERLVAVHGANVSRCDRRGFSPLHYWSVAATMALPHLPQHRAAALLDLPKLLLAHAAVAGAHETKPADFPAKFNADPRIARALLGLTDAAGEEGGSSSNKRAREEEEDVDSDDEPLLQRRRVVVAEADDSEEDDEEDDASGSDVVVISDD